MQTKGVAHRDIKLENLLLGDDMKLVFADFGSAALCRTETGADVLFDSSYASGTAEYNAPEKSGSTSYTAEKAEVFAIGVAAFVMVIGFSPFEKSTKWDKRYSLLCQQDKSAYWKIYNTLPSSPEFKGSFDYYP